MNEAKTKKQSNEKASRKRWIVVAKWVVSIAIISMLVIARKEEILEFFDTEKRYHWWVVGLFTMTAAFTISYVRWHRLANAIDLRLTVWEAVKLGFVGSFFNVVAFGVVGGDSLRAFYAVRHSPGRTPEAILSVFIDRVIGLIVMCGFAAVAFLINGIPGEKSVEKAGIEFACVFAGCAAIAGVGALLVMLYFPGLKRTGLFRWLIGVPKIGGALESVMDAAALYSKKKYVVPLAMIYSLCTNLLFGVTIYLVALAIAPDIPKIGDHFVIAPIAMVANSLPLPGGIGGMEAAMAYLYVSFGNSGGILVALGYRLCILFVSLIGWIVWLTLKHNTVQ
jgi:uncharacterized membrane protein YbhN (UPF0104 family)